MAVSGSPAGRTYVTQEVWEPASMARRSGAWLIDMALLVVVVVAIAALVYLGLGERSRAIEARRPTDRQVRVSHRGPDNGIMLSGSLDVDEQLD